MAVSRTLESAQATGSLLRLDDYLSRPVLETGLPQMRALLPDKGNFS